jgi:hypothetical protein
MEGHYKDGRRLVIFNSMEEVRAKETALKKLIKEWIQVIDQ